MRARPTTLLRRFISDAGGAATIEFVTIFPFLMYFFFCLGEIGTLMARQVMIDRGVDMAIRDLRLGLRPGITHDEFKARICEGAFLLSSCEDVLRLEVTPLADLAGSNYPNQAVRCVNRNEEIQPAVSFDPGGREEIVVVRACLIADPIFPGSASAAMMPRIDAQGGYAIVVTSAFMNEPG